MTRRWYCDRRESGQRLSSGVHSEVRGRRSWPVSSRGASYEPRAMIMDRELEERIALIAADRESGASEILSAAIHILRDALAAPADLRDVVRALRRAQPSMAPIWNATAAALNGDLDRFAQRVARASAAIARFASELLETGIPPGVPLHIVTVSYSGTVADVLEGLAFRRSVHVACSEGRPALEGRRLAVRLAAAGIRVSYYSDAGIGHAVDSADAVLVGADAVAAEWFLNKSGTRMVAALAAERGVPTYVAAGREKFAASPIAARLQPREGDAQELWEEPPALVTVRNPYFEATSLEMVAAVISDLGTLGSAAVADVCLALDREVGAESFDNF
jgi:translation initiation factor 2B subunit (eIF-2B alpha/beta/delta family)